MTEIGKDFEISSTFVWEIDFSSHVKDDSQCKSPNFHVSDLDFYIQIGSGSQPDGLKENISIFLFDYKETSTVVFRLHIKTANSTIGKELTEHHNFAVAGCGSSVLIKRSELLKRMSELVPSGTLTVTCFVKVKKCSPCLFSSEYKVLFTLLYQNERIAIWNFLEWQKFQRCYWH